MRTRIYTAFGHRFYDLSAFIRVRPRPIYGTGALPVDASAQPISRPDAPPGRKLALVLGGGGARGALQVGALRAIIEAGIRPQMLIGTSIGAVNAAFLAIYGFTPAGLAHLEEVWADAKRSNLLSGDYLRMVMRALINRMGRETYNEQMRAFYIRNGITSDLRFGDYQHPQLYCVATNLHSYEPFIFGSNPKHRLLDGVMASSAIPPWIAPIRIGRELMMDGGALSNLPIEPAMRMGATDIIALDLFDPRPPDLEARGFSPFLDKLLTSVEHRQVEMELALARARGAPVLHWRLHYKVATPVWNFDNMEDLFRTGYKQAQAYLRQMQAPPPKRTPQGRRAWRLLRAWLQRKR